MKEYHDGMFSSIKHNILCMMLQIKANAKHNYPSAQENMFIIMEHAEKIMEEMQEEILKEASKQ